MAPGSHKTQSTAPRGSRSSSTAWPNRPNLAAASISFPEAYNTYSSKGLVESKSIFEIYNGWLPNVVLTANMDKMVIEPAA